MCACETAKHGGEVAPHRGKKDDSAVLTGSARLSETRGSSGTEEGQKKKGRMGLTDEDGVTTKRYAHQLWDGLKYSESQRLQKLERPDEIVNIVPTGSP